MNQPVLFNTAGTFVNALNTGREMKLNRLRDQIFTDKAHEQTRVLDANKALRTAVASGDPDAIKALTANPETADVANAYLAQQTDTRQKAKTAALDDFLKRTKVGATLLRGVNDQAEWDAVRPEYNALLGKAAPEVFDPAWKQQHLDSAGMAITATSRIGKMLSDLNAAQARGDTKGAEAIRTAMAHYDQHLAHDDAHPVGALTSAQRNMATEALLGNDQWGKLPQAKNKDAPSPFAQARDFIAEQALKLQQQNPKLSYLAALHDAMKQNKGHLTPAKPDTSGFFEFDNSKPASFDYTKSKNQKYTVGQVVTLGDGTKVKVTGYDNGEPQVVPVGSQ